MPQGREISACSRLRHIISVTKSSTKLGYILIVIAGALTSFFVAPQLAPIVMPWRRPVQDWMGAHGLAAYAGHYGVLNIHLPDIFLYLLAGASIGLFAHRPWLSLAVVYSLAYTLTPSLFFIQITWISSGPAIVIRALGYSLLATIPFALFAAWIASRISKRRHARLHAHEYCAACGYNLFGNVSGRCSECGARIPGAGAVSGTSHPLTNHDEKHRAANN